MYRDFRANCSSSGHSPQGECGLKSLKPDHILKGIESLPARGVWIEIDCRKVSGLPVAVTPRKGSVD